ncbi:vacuolar DHA amino acid exporter [Hysterangium stoloniferum]|nr:vacuolar DHA amino acid exporter [Hysterangium stoloniferum]
MQDNNILTSSTAVSTIHDRADSVDVRGHDKHDTSVPMAHVVSKIVEEEQPPDIEHVYVQDDPRQWSKRRKTFTLVIIAAAALISMLGINIYNQVYLLDDVLAAIDDIKAELHASDQQISLSLSVSILVQGTIPLFWSAVSEIHGRKFVYLISVSFYVIACGVAGSASTMAVLTGMRVLQALGGGAVLTIGASTLADIYEPHERGRVVGIYYAAPLLGPSLGPLIGGAATQLFSWRGTFYLLCIFAGVSLFSFVFFKDTFRRERSLSYQGALQRATKERAEKLCAEAEKSLKRESYEEKRDTMDSVIPNLEAQPVLDEMKLSIKDIRPIQPLIAVLRRKNNLAILLASSALFGFSFCITYTVVRTLAVQPYHYDSFQVGLVLLSFGVGCMGGSLIGGRWSDYSLAKYRLANGRTNSEDRLQSTKPMMLVLPLSLIAYGWMAEKKVNVGGLCVALFFAGFSSIWIYSSTLAYVVDANVGRSSTAVACNALLRGVAGFIAAEIAVPLQDGLGDGGLYTLWAGIMVVVNALVLLTLHKGGVWREAAEEREKNQREKT